MMNAEEKEYMDYLIHNRMQLTNQITKHLDALILLQKKLEIATKALKETRKRLLHVELSGLDGDNRQKMYDLMFEDGVIDKALKEMEALK